jgi:hypothetical protein
MSYAPEAFVSGAWKNKSWFGVKLWRYLVHGSGR